MTLPAPRQTNILLLLSVIGLMAYGLYTQYFQGLIPCPLCMTQRIFYCLFAGATFVAILHSHRYKIYSLIMAFMAIGGIAAAGRQTWLQHLPPELVPACGPSLEYMLETFPFGEALKMLILGDGNCAEVIWTFLSLSMAEWSLVCFIGLLCASLWQFWRPSTPEI